MIYVTLNRRTLRADEQAWCHTAHLVIVVIVDIVVGVIFIVMPQKLMLLSKLMSPAPLADLGKAELTW